MSAPVRLTDAGVPKFRAKPKRYEIRDKETPGLRLTVFPSGARTWCVRYTVKIVGSVKGEKRKRSLGEYPTVTLGEARDLAFETVRDARKGVDKSKAVPPAFREDGAIDPATLKLGSAVAEYDAMVISKRAKNTQPYIRRELQEALAVWGPDTLLSAIKKPQVNLLLHKIDKLVPPKPHKYNTALKVYRAFFNFCIREGWLDAANPTFKLEKKGKADGVKPRERFLDFGELRIVWNAAVNRNGAFGALIRLLILSGCRASEMSDLRWEEVNGEYIKIPEYRVKTREEHWVPVTPAIRKILDAVPHRTGYVVSNDGGITPVSPNCYARKTLGVQLNEHFTLHDLRRSFASGCRKLGIDRDVIKACINHKEGDVTAIYQRHDLRPEIDAAFATWSAHCEAGFPVVEAQAA